MTSSGSVAHRLRRWRHRAEGVRMLGATLKRCYRERSNRRETNQGEAAAVHKEYGR
jgi:hypothetical protein